MFREFCSLDDISEKIIAEALKLDDSSDIVNLEHPLRNSGLTCEISNTGDYENCVKASNTDKGFEFVHENREYVTYNEIVYNSKSYDGDVVKEIDRVNNNSDHSIGNDIDGITDYIQEGIIGDDSPILRSLICKSVDKNEEHFQELIKEINEISSQEEIDNAISSSIDSFVDQTNSRDGKYKHENNNDKFTKNENKQRLCNYNPAKWLETERTKSLESNVKVQNIKDTTPTDLAKEKSNKKRNKVKM